MTIYHGSTALVKKPKILDLDKPLDFGVGFYTTTSYEQAERWARTKMCREKVDIGFVSIYEFDYDTAKDETIISKFETADMAWLNFVVNNRKGMRFDEDIDMHVGPVADDNVYQAVLFYESGVYDAEETIRRLKTEILQDQWTFHTEKMLSFLRFIGFKEIREMV